MKYNFFYFLIILFYSNSHVVAQQKFTNIPYDSMTIREVSNVVELNSHYYFLTNVLISNNKTKSIIYKTDLTGSITDSIILTAATDSTIMLQNIYRTGNEIKIFGASCNFDTGNNIPVDFDFLQFNLDDDLNITNSYTIPISDTNKLIGFSNAKLIDDKVFYCFTFNTNLFS